MAIKVGFYKYSHKLTILLTNFKLLENKGTHHQNFRVKTLQRQFTTATY